MVRPCSRRINEKGKQTLPLACETALCCSLGEGREVALMRSASFLPVGRRGFDQDVRRPGGTHAADPQQVGLLASGTWEPYLLQKHLLWKTATSEEGSPSAFQKSKSTLQP